MPELPEVETIARGLHQRVTGEAINSVWLGAKPEPLKSTALEIARVLEGSRIGGVRRVGKHIVFDLERNPVARAPWSAKNRKPRPARPGFKTRPAQASATTPGVGDKACLEPAEGGIRSTPAGPMQGKSQWIVHLGMTGRLQVCEPQDEVLKHTHAIVQLASGRELRFVDPRRFGRLSVTRDATFEAGGFEPLEVELDRFTVLFHGRNTPIKSALLNQKLLRGVGNIYADESLFRAGIRPRRRAASIPHEQLRRLFLSIKEVLQEAIALGGSSISDYVDADGEEGSFQFEHRVYGREGEPCVVCKTPLKRVVIAGRSSHYCPKCQK
jgi:formamidopyrimidine-DNA glycosylase